jgi:hypothetical protein
MGEVIRKNAAALAILLDARTTLRNARERSGEVQRLADEKLAAVLTLADDVETRLRAARDEAAPLLAAVAVQNDLADRLLGRVSDDIWNLVGRPASDPALDILFPGGVTYYADGDVDEQPERMDLLVELLRSGIHPHLPAERAAGLAAEVADASGLLRAKVEAARPVEVRVALLGRVHAALARTAQIQLAALKRMYKANGMSEADIHKVIPDRPSSTSAGKIETPAS